jgi:hypothetical protein
MSELTAGGREPGFLGMVAAGATPAEAWQSIRDEAAADPGTRAIFADLESTEEGRAALEASRQAWRRHGLPAPFDGLPGTGPGKAGET